MKVINKKANIDWQHLSDCCVVLTRGTTTVCVCGVKLIKVSDVRLQSEPTPACCSLNDSNHGFISVTAVRLKVFWITWSHVLGLCIRVPSLMKPPRYDFEFYKKRWTEMTIMWSEYHLYWGKRLCEISCHSFNDETRWWRPLVIVSRFELLQRLKLNMNKYNVLS